MNGRTNPYIFTELKKFDVDEETYTFMECLNVETKHISYGICLEPDANQDGCDVQELPHDIACKILARITGVYVYDDKNQETIADYSMEGKST